MAALFPRRRELVSLRGGLGEEVHQKAQLIVNSWFSGAIRRFDFGSMCKWSIVIIFCGDYLEERDLDS